jgi:hypothetical protein
VEDACEKWRELARHVYSSLLHEREVADDPILDYVLDYTKH